MFASRADPTELAVLYLDAPTGDSALGLLAARITEDLIDDLSRTGAVQVRSAAEVSRIRQAPQRLSVAARTLGAGMLITGRVAGAAELPTVVLRLVDDEGVQLDSRDITDIPVGPGVGWSALRDSVMVVARSWIGKELAERNRLAGLRNVEAWTLVHESDVNRQRARALAEAGDPESASRALDQADSVLRLAARRDTGWLEPLLQRAWLSIDRIDLLERLPAPEVPEITRAGIQLADSVIARKSDPRALEVRGVLLFREALNGRTSSDSLLALAERDLRAAAGPAHPAQARALTELSWVLFERAAAAEALVAAREASRADRLQIESERVLFSLYLTSLTADSVRTAAGACDEGYRRFPKNWLFTFCRLAVMVLPDGRVPEPQSAWRMFDEMGRLAPPGVRPYQSRWRAMVAAVLARAGLEDSARRTLARARKDGDGDVEMPFYDAAARMALGDRKGALASLDIYLQANPGMRHPIRLDPMFQPLRSDVGFQALVAVPDSTGLKE
jgi:hypothetical protein